MKKIIAQIMFVIGMTLIVPFGFIQIIKMLFKLDTWLIDFIFGFQDSELVVATTLLLMCFQFLVFIFSIVLLDDSDKTV